MNIVNQGHEQGAILEDEAKMITNIFEFGDKDVTDVMTSRKKIDGIDCTMSLEEALHFMLDEPYSRFPLYEEDIDHIIGVLYLKDVIDAYINNKDLELYEIAREPFYVHQTMNLSVLFQEMQTNPYGDRCGRIQSDRRYCLHGRYAGSDRWKYPR